MAVNQAICYLKDGLVATSQTGDLAMTISRQLSDLQSETTSEEARLDKLIDIQFSALPLFPRTPGIFSALGESYMSRYELHDQLSDLDKAIYYDDLAASIAAEQAHQSTPDLFHNVGISHQRRFRHSGQTEDIEKAIKFMTDAVACIPLGQPNLHLVLANLGNSHILRYRRSGRLEDIDLAIANQANAVGLVQNHVKYMAKHLGALGSSHLHRYRHQGEAPDIENAVEFQTVALSFLEHPVDPSLLANLALTYLARQEYDYGDLGDIETAVALQSQALNNIAQEISSEPLYGNMLTKFTQPDTSKFLPDCLRVPISPKEATAHLKATTFSGSYTRLYGPLILGGLGVSYQRRFFWTGDRKDIDTAIELQTHAISLTLDKHPNRPLLLKYLGSSHCCRFQMTGSRDLSDINQAIEFHTQSISLLPGDDVSKANVLYSLGLSYLSRFDWSGNPLDIDAATSLETQAVSSIGEHAKKPYFLGALGECYMAQFRHAGKVANIEAAIKHFAHGLSLVQETCHDQHSVLLDAMGTAHLNRYLRLGKLSDLDSAISNHKRAVDLLPEKYVLKLGSIGNLGHSHHIRHRRLGGLKDIDAAISLQDKALQLAPKGHTLRPMLLDGLGCSYRARFSDLGKPADIDEAIKLQLQSVDLTPEKHLYKLRRLNNLGLSYVSRFQSSFGVRSDIDQAIRIQKEAIQLASENCSSMHTLLSNLGNAYTYRFLKLSEDEDLEEAIHFKNKRSQFFRKDTLTCHSVSIDQALSNYQCAAESPTGSPSLRFEAARTWAELCSLHRSELQLQAYRQLVTLIPELVWVGMTVRRRFKDIATIKGVVNQAAAAAIALGEYNLAFEWLEEGRSIVWSQLLQLRTPLDDIRAANAALADRLEMVAHQLDQAGNTERAEISLLDTGVSREQSARRHRRLAEEWNQLLDQARKTPGCRGFLLPKTTIELACAAQTRTIVLVNVHEDRCDALALLPGSIDVVHIPLLKLSYEKVVRIYSSLKKCLARVNVRQRDHRRPVYPEDEHTSNGDPLNFVLLDLWDSIVEPILSHLGYLRRSPGQPLPHVTWCPTGPLAFLPLHAAGRYDDHPARVYDYVISSYTPTVGALVNRKSRSGNFQGILAVGQSATVDLRPLPGTVTELAKIREIAGDNCQFTALDGKMATPTAVLDAMDKHSWVHFACHGSQNYTTDPTTSAFHLHNSTLTLSAIMRKQIKDGGLAFLSACETATGDDTLPDEAVHLAAGMMMAGYPSVIGTMWSIEDVDAPLVAEKLYSYLLDGGKADETKAAHALHYAVQYLRDQVGEKSFERWVPYIHIGI